MILKQRYTVQQRAHEQNKNVYESPTRFQQNINATESVSRKVTITLSFAWVQS